MAQLSKQPVDLAFTKALPKIEVSSCRSFGLGQRSRTSTVQFQTQWRSCQKAKLILTLKRKFFPVFSNLIYLLCSDIEGLRYSTRRVLQGFQDDGVRYLELRTTPRENQRHEVSKNDYVSAVLDVIDEFENDQMSTYLILSIDRTKSAASALEVVDLAVEYKGRGVVAVELSGDPSRGEVSIFKDAFARAKEHGLYVTLHFAETASSSCPAELETLLSFQPERLGHVINVLNEFKEDIARRKVALELCLSCNVYANKGVFPITISDIGGIKIVQ
ncbi:hypothetical protein LOZ66_003684 [Ophidiomyces ophidiicola]|nr:hypothetical protein LOZ66_003684 [Ophidiomyces ophidiicola]